MTYRTRGFVVAVCAFGIDQTSKGIVLATASLQAGIEVFPFFNLVLVHNHGVSFGLLSGFTPWWALASLSLVVVAILFVWLWQTHSGLLSIGLGLLIGGALANALDRIRHGAVIDFLDFHFAQYHWPAFNLADAAIVCGAGLLIIETLRSEQRPQSAAGRQ
jgi:signal peptidase II